MSDDKIVEFCLLSISHALPLLQQECETVEPIELVLVDVLQIQHVSKSKDTIGKCGRPSGLKSFCKHVDDLSRIF